MKIRFISYLMWLRKVTINCLNLQSGNTKILESELTYHNTFSYFQTVKNLIKLGFPVLVTQVGIIAVSFADTMMVGAYGLNELAASAFVNSLFLIAIVMILGFSGGIVPIIGALYGKGEHQEAGIMLRASIIVNGVLSLGFFIVMLSLFFFLDYFGQDPDILPLARSYFLLILFTIIPMAIFNCFQQTCNGINDTATPMWIILGADVLNIIGNYALIFGKWGFPELGLLGAGWSTLAARIAGVLAIICVYCLSPKYRPYWRSMLSNRSGSLRKRQIWLTSYPLMVQSGVECGLWTFGAVVSGWFGKVQLAAYQVMNTIGQLGFMIYLSFGWATSIKVANFTGVGDFPAVKHVTRVGLHIILVLATFASLVFLFFTDKLVGYFTPDAEVASYALLLIAPLVLYQYCDGTQLTYVNALRGTSIVQPLLWISIVSYILIGIPALFLLAVTFRLETVGVYYSFSAALLSAAILLVINFRLALKKLRNQKK
ncbi:MAG: MATE family efflux transporter [Muribaculaceae bacterium]|nr:MATE family efflux transporter [Muribaculaceae bacterium]